MGEWIKVSERLPEHLQKVLVYDEMGKMNTALFLKHSNGSVDWCTAVRLGCEVTHWCYLPQPPEAEK